MVQLNERMTAPSGAVRRSCSPRDRGTVHQPATTSFDTAGSAPAHAVEVRVAALVRQGRRRDGVREFVAALTVSALLVSGALAYTRGTPPKPATPAPAPAAVAIQPAG